MRVRWSLRSRRLIGAIAVLVLVGLAAALATGAASNADDDDGPPPANAAATHAASACGAQSTTTVANVDELVAERIYQGELLGRETVADEAHVRRSPALLSALASGDNAAVAAAVSAIVYTPHWHIVRLRVLRAGHVVADVGGPYIIAPVTGTLSEHGRTLGHFVMSVQDDTGYVKLVTRFIGVPVDLYHGHSFLMGTLMPAPSLPRPEAKVVLQRAPYLARVFSAGSFPDGTLGVALLVPTPSASLSSLGCEQLRADAWGSVAMHVAARLQPLSAHYQDLVRVVRAASGGSVFVLAGRHEIAGGRPPRHLPAEGNVRIGGKMRWVFSWLVARGVRVYVVAPA